MRRTLRKTGPEETRDLLDESLGGQEGIILLSELLHKFFVLVKPEYIPVSLSSRVTGSANALFEVINRHVLKVNLLRTVDVCRICENADGHAGTRDIREPMYTHQYIVSYSLQCMGGHSLDGTRETLVTLGIIVLQTDLKLNRLDEVALLLAVGLSQ